MGKPYQSELHQLAATYRWALSLDTRPLEDRLNALGQSSLLVVGSGGSQSTAQLISDLHQRRFGQLSKADTPLIARSYLPRFSSSAIALVSAGGRNPDILGIAREAVESEPKSLIALCSSRNSPLSRIVNSFSRGFSFEFDLPGGKDGFLATNSLLALSTVALAAYGFGPHDVSLHGLLGARGLRHGLGQLNAQRRFFDCKYLVVLYGPESRVAAIDLESKLVEAGLVSVQLSDYRNFAHGRHHWIAKNPNTAVVALAANEEIPLAALTLKLLPSTVPKHLLKTQYSAPTAWLALQEAVFELVAEYGKAKNIDPGRPGVPPFGRRVYHFNAFRKKRESIVATSVRRKLLAADGLRPFTVDELNHGYNRLVTRISHAKFHGLILDYDGTICDSIDRFRPIPEATVRALCRITAAGFFVGVATGRGKSVREALQAALPKSHRQRVWIGYYNGGTIARLDDDAQPDIQSEISPELRAAANALGKLKSPPVELAIRPQQITVECKTAFDTYHLWHTVLQCLEESGLAGLKTVISTRSVDVIPVKTSKLAVLEKMKQVCPGGTFLCIGDKPRWPGNDAELLSHEFSLSVDEVDAKPDGVWNAAPAGILGSAALRYYVQLLTFRSRHFQMKLR